MSFPAAAQQSFDDLNWPAGRWLGTTGKATFRDYCMRAEGCSVLNMGCTLNDGKLASFEAMRIELDTDNMLVFVPRPFGKIKRRFPLLKKY